MSNDGLTPPRTCPSNNVQEEATIAQSLMLSGFAVVSAWNLAGSWLAPIQAQCALHLLASQQAVAAMRAARRHRQLFPVGGVHQWN